MYEWSVEHRLFKCNLHPYKTMSLNKKYFWKRFILPTPNNYVTTLKSPTKVGSSSELRPAYIRPPLAGADVLVGCGEERGGGLITRYLSLSIAAGSNIAAPTLNSWGPSYWNVPPHLTSRRPRNVWFYRLGLRWVVSQTVVFIILLDVVIIHLHMSNLIIRFLNNTFISNNIPK